MSRILDLGLECCYLPLHLLLRLLHLARVVLFHLSAGLLRPQPFQLPTLGVRQVLPRRHSCDAERSSCASEDIVGSSL